MHAQGDTIQWLLEDDEPSLRFRTLRELLDYGDETAEVRRAKTAIPDSEPVQAVLGKMHPDGYWLQKNPRTGEIAGEGVEYGAFASTHFCLAYLAELGLDRSHPQVAKAAERYLDLQQPDGDWYRHLSCLLGYNIRTFARLGYRDDRRLLRALRLLAQTERQDGGYLCELHEGKYRHKAVKSCIRGCVKALLAFSEFPDYWEHPRCQQLVNYFLFRGGIFQSGHPSVPVNHDLQNLSFPSTWRANSWEILYALSKMGYGTDQRLAGAWERLEQRADPVGRFPLDWTSTHSPWKVGQRGKANKWVTFYIEVARKYRRSTPDRGVRCEVSGAR